MTRRCLAGTLLVFALLAAAGCADRSDSGSGPADDGGSSDEGEAADGGAEGEAAFGDIEAPCGERDPDTPDQAFDDPAETQGVTEDSIAVGTVSDPGFEGQPGLNQELFDASEAFAEWCNEQGGINGHQIDLTLYDAAISQYQQRMSEACDQEFAMVGGGAVSDNQWETTGQACGLIDVAGFAVTPEKAGEASPTFIEDTRTIQPVPNPSNQWPVGTQVILGEQFPDATDQAAILYGDLATLQVQKDRQVEAMEAAGYELVQETSYNILGEANWAPFAQSIADDEIEYLTFVGEGQNMANLQIALADIGYEPEVMQVDTNLYDPNYLESAGDTAEGTFTRTSFWPLEDAESNPATQDYVDLVEARDGKVALLGAQSMSAWLLFAQLATECDLDGDLTRSCILAKGAEVDEWTGGGLHAPADPAGNAGPQCTIILQVQDGEFVRFEPAEADGGDDGYACDPSYVADLEGDYSTSG